MNKIKTMVFTNWGFMRWTRLGLAILASIQAISMQNGGVGIIAAFFFFQALTNTGCCGVGGCAVPVQKKGTDETKEVEYEEIKNKNGSK